MKRFLVLSITSITTLLLLCVTWWFFKELDDHLHFISNHTIGEIHFVTGIVLIVEFLLSVYCFPISLVYKYVQKISFKSMRWLLYIGLFGLIILPLCMVIEMMYFPEPYPFIIDYFGKNDSFTYMEEHHSISHGKYYWDDVDDYAYNDSILIIRQMPDGTHVKDNYYESLETYPLGIGIHHYWIVNMDKRQPYGPMDYDEFIEECNKRGITLQFKSK